VKFSTAITVGFIFCLAAFFAPAREWIQGNHYRHSALDVPTEGKAGFTLMDPAQLGIFWTNILTAQSLMERQNFINGAGVAAGDFDGDGLIDLYLCNRQGPNALFRNLGGWRFTNVTEQAGVSGGTNLFSSGATFADINGNGRLDLLVTSFLGSNLCFVNIGNGQFSDVTAASGLDARGGATSLALGDLSGDGHLDLYVNFFGIDSVLRDGLPYSIRMTRGQPVVIGRYARRLKIIDGKLTEIGEPDVLYRNDGQGRFQPLPWPEFFQDETGRAMEAPWDFGLAVQIRDLTGNGFPDIYVCNDFESPERFWINDGQGRFRALPSHAMRNMSYNSMGVDFADIDRDGHLDFFVLDMLPRQHSRRMTQTRSLSAIHRIPGADAAPEDVGRNTLYWNRGDGTYAEIANYAGLAASDWSWCPIFLDVDLDGYEDILVTNGTAWEIADRDLQGKAKLRDPLTDTPNAAFRNRGDLTFEDVTVRWGFDSTIISHGMALADLDGDGDLDVIVNGINSPPLIYRNDTTAPRIAVRLKGNPPNTRGIGAKITLRGGPVLQTQEVLAGGRYLSGDDPMRVFATGRSTNLTIEVVWRNGRKSVVENARPNHLYEIAESGAKAVRREPRIEPMPVFTDRSDLLGHSHFEEAFDDFARQPLLPRKLSQPGPGVAWLDLNGNGYDDLIIGSGKGGGLGIFLNDGKGGFARVETAQAGFASLDQTGLAGWAAADGARLLVGETHYEAASETSSVLREFMFRDGRLATNPASPPIPANAGALALGDLNGNGMIDLFVGGYVVPGRYPEAAPSSIHTNSAGGFVFDQQNSAALSEAGLVSGACFSDLTGDGQLELILACEWGPIKIFRSEQGKLVRWNAPVILNSQPSTLNQLTGWWTSVTTGDIDGDGRLDIIAGNWGLNTAYSASADRPARLYSADFTQRGILDLVEASYDPDLRKVVPLRDLDALAASLPFLKQKTPTHRAFSTASLDELFVNKLQGARQLQATTLESMLFLNRGEFFEAHPLPREAQFAPVFGINVADLDGDGHEDIFLAQNFFAVHPFTARLDAGRGLWLRGTGRGQLEPVPGQISGIAVYGEQRGSALADFDGDGRVDLVVTQNGAATKLYQNTGAKPGLRVRLTGSENNRSAIGAKFRLVYGDRMGPVREIKAGAGYWSQDSSTQVMGKAEEPSAIWVQWPSGRKASFKLGPGFREITGGQDDGELKSK
jgi:enediyne biosynthesis protein E4